MITEQRWQLSEEEIQNVVVVVGKPIWSCPLWKMSLELVSASPSFCTLFAFLFGLEFSISQIRGAEQEEEKFPLSPRRKKEI